MATDTTPKTVRSTVRAETTPVTSNATRVVRVVAEALVVAVAAVVVAVPLLELWRVDWDVPFSYDGGDANFIAMLTKTIEDHGWYQRNPDLGAPFGQVLYDFPQGGDNFHLFALRVLTIPLSFAGALNAFYILTFSAVAV